MIKFTDTETYKHNVEVLIAEDEIIDVMMYHNPDKDKAWIKIDTIRDEYKSKGTALELGRIASSLANTLDSKGFMQFPLLYQAVDNQEVQKILVMLHKDNVSLIEYSGDKIEIRSKKNPLYAHWDRIYIIENDPMFSVKVEYFYKQICLAMGVE